MSPRVPLRQRGHASWGGGTSALRAPAGDGARCTGKGQLCAASEARLLSGLASPAASSPPSNPKKLQRSNKRRVRTCIRSRKRLHRNSFPGAPERIRTSGLRFRKLCAVVLRGSQYVLGMPNLAKRGKTCPYWFLREATNEATRICCCRCVAGVLYVATA